MKIYRVAADDSDEFVSMVSGFMRFEEYNKVDSAYVYTKKNATEIMNLANRMSEKLRKDPNIPASVCQTTHLQEVDINDVLLSHKEIASAVDKSLSLGIDIELAIRVARWERVRKYQEWYHYNSHTPSHRYIYAHSYF